MAFGICYGYTVNGYHRTQWLQLITAFKPDYAWEIGLDQDLPNIEGVQGIQSAGELPPEMDLVVFSPTSARHIIPTISLPDFQFANNQIYMFGPDTECLSETQLGNTTNYTVVSIPTCSDDEKDELFSFQAGAVVLYDKCSRG